ncbi:MAG: FHA domain-containing protein [Phycisphaerae bacterium]
MFDTPACVLGGEFPGLLPDVATRSIEVDVKFVLFKNGHRKDFDIPSDACTTVGRGVDCGLRIPVTDVSRVHAEVTVENGTVTIRDKGSVNGTFVNDGRIVGIEQSLRPGDTVKIGPCVFTVQINGKPAEIVSPEELAALMGDDDSGLIEPLVSAPQSTQPAASAGAQAVSDGDVADLDLDALGLDDTDKDDDTAGDPALSEGDVLDMLEELDPDEGK